MIPRAGRTLLGLTMAVSMAAACSQAPASGGSDKGPVMTPSDLFAGLEGRLLARDRLSIDFDITAADALEGRIEGTLWIEGDGMTLQAAGELGGAPLAVSMSVADDRLLGGSDTRRFDEPVPPDLKGAMLLGLTRMGLLHNVARLAAGAPPDRGDGTVREWVTVENVEWAQSFHFDIHVGGQATADARLWLDESGMPRERRQTVRFPGGAMQVHEVYVVR